MRREIEHIVIVDKNDVALGEKEKKECHNGRGILHRAFLVMCFNKKGELLLARRNSTKRLWDGFWDGTVASHVLTGESYEQASKRRLREEIGLAADNIGYLFKFLYKARYKNRGTEHEICAVLVVKDVECNSISVNPDEISEIKFISPRQLMHDITKGGDIYTPWLILAAEHMNLHQGSIFLSGPACAGNRRP